MGASKFVKGILIGAAVGGAITLFDKETRQKVFSKSKRLGNSLLETVKNPNEKIEGIKKTINQLQHAYNEINEDIRFIVEKAQEIKEVSKETGKLINETKETFVENPSSQEG